MVALVAFTVPAFAGIPFDVILQGVREREAQLRSFEAVFSVTLPDRENHVFFDKAKYTFSDFQERLEGKWDFPHWEPEARPTQTYAWNGKRLMTYQVEANGGQVKPWDIWAFFEPGTPLAFLGYKLTTTNKSPYSLGRAMEAFVEPPAVSVTEIDGTKALLVVGVSQLHGPKDPPHELRLWLDPARQFVPLQIEVRGVESPEVAERLRQEGWLDAATLLRRLARIRYVRDSATGTWFPSEGEDTVFMKQMELEEGWTMEKLSAVKDPQEARKAIRRVYSKVMGLGIYRYRLDSLRCGIEIPDKTFEIDFPAGTRVWDEFLQQGYVVGEAPGELVSAMMKDMDGKPLGTPVPTPSAEPVAAVAATPAPAVPSQPDPIPVIPELPAERKSVPVLPLVIGGLLGLGAIFAALRFRKG